MEKGEWRRENGEGRMEKGEVKKRIECLVMEIILIIQKNDDILLKL
ncbi:MAG: hypothetical protein ACMUIL_07080 [bacterium]